MAKRLMKLGIKASILTGAVYYTIDQGLWEDTDKADKVYAELYQAAAPYFKEVPVEVPEVPSISDLAASSKFYYNQGVIATGEFFKRLPSNAAVWSSELKTTLSTLLETPASTSEAANSASDSAANKAS